MKISPLSHTGSGSLWVFLPVALVDPAAPNFFLQGHAHWLGLCWLQLKAWGPLLLLPRALPPFPAPGLQPRNNPHTCYHRTDFWFGLDGRGRKSRGCRLQETGRRWRKWHKDLEITATNFPQERSINSGKLGETSKGCGYCQPPRQQSHPLELSPVRTNRPAQATSSRAALTGFLSQLCLSGLLSSNPSPKD